MCILRIYSRTEFTTRTRAMSSPVPRSPAHTAPRFAGVPAPCPAQRAQGLSRAQQRQGTGRRSAFAAPRGAAASLPRGPEARPRPSSALLPATLGEAILGFSSLSQEQAAPSRSLPSAYNPTLGQPLSPAVRAAAPGPPANLSRSAAAVFPAPPTRAFSAGAALRGPAGSMEEALRRELGTALLRPAGHSGGGCISQGQSYGTDRGRVYVKSNSKAEVGG